MFVCMFVCVLARVYVVLNRMHDIAVTVGTPRFHAVRVRARVRARLCESAYVNVFVCICACMRVCVHVCVCVFTWVCV